jgi:hypothetical protein
LIKPTEISSRILTLLDESDERVILVSPYMKISKWHRFVKKVNELIARRVRTEIYVRDDPDNKATYRDLDHLGLPYKKIPHLHSKLYLNEGCGIVTSMNLLLSSEINSLEIGYATENRMEYNYLLAYYHRYIRTGEPLHCDPMAGQPTADLKQILNSFREELQKTGKNSWPWIAGNKLHITTSRNNYSVSIKDGSLRITTRPRMVKGKKTISNRQTSLIVKKVGDLTAMNIEIHPDPVPGTLQLSGLAKHTMNSICITEILKAETVYIMETAIRFVDVIEDLKIK